MNLVRNQNPVARNPLAELDRFVDAAFANFARAPRDGSSSAAFTRVDEDEQGYTLRLDLPGIRKEQVTIEVAEGTLKVEAKSDEENNQRHYARRFTLPEAVDTEAISATLADGVLTLSLPKAEAVKPRSITVN